jgi:hypothetical protein
MNKRTGRYTVILSLGVVAGGLLAATFAQAACGAVQCFVVIGSQQQVPEKGTMTMNFLYNYTPQRSLLDGTNGVIPAVNQQQRKLILDHHRELSTITQTVTLDLNYGVTEQFGVQVTAPYIKRRHEHIDGLGESNGGAGTPRQFSDGSLGDLRVTAKYNVAPGLRQAVVLGLGVDLPTGETNARDSSGGIMEAPLQTGRGQVGLIGSAYQTYTLIPGTLSEYAFGSYRHTFRNNDGYQFGDEYLLNAGLNYTPTARVTLTAQFNYRYLTHDNMSASLKRSPVPGEPDFGVDTITVDPLIRDRRVPNTGSTYLAVTPGIQVSVSDLTSVYFYSQVPIARDFNNNIAQGTSFVFGLTRFFPNFFGS